MYTYVLCLVSVVAGYPYNDPNRVLMYRGYYPSEEGYAPPQLMYGESIATMNLVPRHHNPRHNSEPIQPVQIKPAHPEEQEDNEPAPIDTVRKTKPSQNHQGASNKPTVVQANDEPVEKPVDAYDPLRRGESPGYNVFFPISFAGQGAGGGLGRATGGQESQFPSSVAIANSFSTGQGGVASSRATAYGDPNLSKLFSRYGGFNNRAQSVKKHTQRPKEDEEEDEVPFYN